MTDQTLTANADAAAEAVARIAGLRQQIGAAHSALDVEESMLVHALLPSAASLNWEYTVETGDEGESFVDVASIWITCEDGTQIPIPHESEFNDNSWMDGHESSAVDALRARLEAPDALPFGSPEDTHDAYVAALASDLGVAPDALPDLVSAVTYVAYRNATRYQLEEIPVGARAPVPAPA